MAQWHLPIWISALCLLTACGSNVPASDSSSTGNADAEEAIAQPNSSTTELESVPVGANSSPSEVDLAALAEPIIVPGDRVGPVTADTSRTDLVELFGEAALEDTEIPVGEGFTEFGTTVYSDTEKAFSVIWVDDSQEKPATIKDFGAAWQTPHGIQIGMPFAELQEILGPFDLYGFGWDYGGTVVLEGSNLDEYYGLLILRLQPDAAAVQQEAKAFQAVQGDKLIAAEDPNLLPLDLEVNEIIVYLNSPVE